MSHNGKHFAAKFKEFIKLSKNHLNRAFLGIWDFPWRFWSIDPFRKSEQQYSCTYTWIWKEKRHLFYAPTWSISLATSVFPSAAKKASFILSSWTLIKSNRRGTPSGVSMFSFNLCAWSPCFSWKSYFKIIKQAKASCWRFSFGTPLPEIYVFDLRLI